MKRLLLLLSLPVLFAALVAQAQMWQPWSHGTATVTPSLTGITLSSNTFTCGTSGTVGAVTVQGTGSISAATLSLTGTDAAQFSLSSTTVPSNLTVGASPAGCPRSYAFNIVATLAGATGSPFTAAETVTGSSGGGYAGLGDLAVTDSMTVLGYWGLRAYKASTATTANMAGICDSAGANCTIMKGNSNGTMNLTVLSNSHDCVASADCKVGTWYGGVGTEGNGTNAIVNMPGFMASGVFGMSKPVLFCDVINHYLQTSTSLASGSIPATYVAVAAASTANTFMGIMGDQGGQGEGLLFGGTGTTVYVGGSNANFLGPTISASKWYAIVGVGQLSGSTSTINANGTQTTTTTNLGASWGGGAGWSMCHNGWSNNNGAYIGEVAVIAGDQTSHITDILNNLKTAWGFTYP